MMLDLLLRKMGYSSEDLKSFTIKDVLERVTLHNIISEYEASLTGQ